MLKRTRAQVVALAIAAAAVIAGASLAFKAFSTGTLAYYSTIPAASYFTSSLFNQLVASWPVVSNTTALVNKFVADDILGTYKTVNIGTQPLYFVPANQPLVPVSLTSGCNNFIGSTVGESPPSVPIPVAIVSLNGSGDNPLSLYQPSSGTEYEYWQAIGRSSGPWSACFGGSMEMATSVGTFPNGYGRSATSISEVDTMITENDVYHDRDTAPTSFGHALSVAIPRCNGFVWPATRGDCGSETGQLSEGSYLRFPAGLSCTGSLNSPATDNPDGAVSSCPTPFSQMVFDTIQAHGMVVIDFSGGVDIEAEQPSDWAAQGHSALKPYGDPISDALAGEEPYVALSALPWASLQVVVPPGCPSNCPT